MRRNRPYPSKASWKALAVKIVRESLANAKENGFTFDGWTDEQVALDLNRYCADVDGWKHENLVEAVRLARL